MKEQKFKAIGITPLATHNNQTANPLNPYAKVLKILTSKRKKTDQDVMEIARIEWEAGLYLHEGIVAIPARCLDATFLKAAKKTKNGVKYKEGAMVLEDYCPLNYRPPKIKIKENNQIPNPELDRFYGTTNYQDMVKVGNSMILRTRPIFNEWSLEFTMMFDENIFDLRTIKDIIETAGKYVGFCEERPRKGKFEIEKT